MFCIIFCGLYLMGRVFIPLLAEKDSFFSSPKLGRIKAQKRCGRIIGFFDNLAGKNRYTNKMTGKIEIGEINPDGFWWKFFGVYFIGLDEVAKYKIATEAIEDISGKFQYVEEEASSIFLDGAYPLTAQFVTKDGVGLKIKLQIILTTLDAAKALSLPVSWTIPVFGAVLGATRKFVGSKSLEALISAQGNIAENGNTDLITEILDLNTTKIGGISLEEMCGQYIKAVNIIDLEFADLETKKAFTYSFIACQEARKKIKDAEAYAGVIKITSEADRVAAVNIAASITLKGSAEADVYGKKHESLGGNTNTTAQVIVAEQQSEMKNLTTLVLGGNSIIAIPTKKKGDK